MKWIFGILLIMLLQIACNTGDQLPFPVNKPQLVVYSWINPNKLFSVYISLSDPLNAQPQTEFRKDCIVEIQIPGKGSEFLSSLNDGNYISTNMYPEPGKLYRLKIIDPVYGKVSSEETMPFLPSNIEFGDTLRKFSEKILGDYTINKYKYSLQLPSTSISIPNFYHLLIKDEFIDQFGKDSMRYVSIDPAIENNTLVKLFNEGSLLINVEKATLEGKSKIEIEFETSYLTAKETPLNLELELRCISGNYYKHFNSIYYQLKGNVNPLENPPPLFSNITNGLGLFGAYNPILKQIKYP